MTDRRLTQPQALEYTEALAQVTAGSWRQIALGVELGVPDTLGLTTREWVQDRLGGYVRLAIPERKEAATELVANGHTQREAADILGVGLGTVHRDTEPVPNGTPEAPPTPELVPNGTPAAAPTPTPEPNAPSPEPGANGSPEPASTPEPEANVPPSPEYTEWTEQQQHDSELRAARANLASVLLHLTSRTVPPDQLAQQDYSEVAHEFDPADLRYAAETMNAILDLGTPA